MRISVKVKANTSREKIEKVDDANFLVWIKEKPVKGRANEAVAKALTEYFGIAKSSVVLLKGRTSKHKIFEVKISPHLFPLPKGERVG